MEKTERALTQLTYGKDNVRLMTTHVLPSDPSAPCLAHKVVSEFTVRVLLSGPAFVDSYTKADNALVVATDTIKNSVYALAKQTQHPLMDAPEKFALEVGCYFVAQFSHVEVVDVKIEHHNWSPISVTTFAPVNDVTGSTGTAISSSSIDSVVSPAGVGKNRVNVKTVGAHPHSFLREASQGLRLVRLVYNRDGKYELRAGLKGLLVLKTTGSSFENFHKSKYRTLPDMADRILSTDVDVTYEVKQVCKIPHERLNVISSGLRQMILDVFANHNSPSVQNTLYRIADLALATFPEIDHIHMALPNKHSFTYDLDRFGLKNTGGNATVFAPQSDPNGLITATISRSGGFLTKRFIPSL